MHINYVKKLMYTVCRLIYPRLNTDMSTMLCDLGKPGFRGKWKIQNLKETLKNCSSLFGVTLLNPPLSKIVIRIVALYTVVQFSEVVSLVVK